MSGGTPRHFILCWSPDERDFAFLKANEAVAQIAPVIVSPSLPAVVRTALGRPKAVIVLRPVTAAEHGLVEEFLLKIDRQNKINSHYVIVISDKGKHFKSGVQSHSVINTFDEAAVVRAALHGSTVITVPGEDESYATRFLDEEAAGTQGEAEEGSLAEPMATPEAEASGPLPLPTLLEYFKLPAFKKPAPLVTQLSSDDREHLAIAFGELAHADLGLPKNADAIERSAAWARKFRSTEVAIVSRAELLRFGPTRSELIKPDQVPPPGAGALLNAHKLGGLLEVQGTMSLHYFWITELDCCLLCWGESKENNLFVQALMYTVLRMRKSEKFRVRKAA